MRGLSPRGKLLFAFADRRDPRLLAKLREYVFQHQSGSLQHVVIPIACYPEASAINAESLAASLSEEACWLPSISMTKAPLEADEIKNKASKGHLTTKLEVREAMIAEQLPHARFSIGRLSTHLLCEVADALSSRSMVWRLRHEPLIRRGLRPRHLPPQGGKVKVTSHSPLPRPAAPGPPHAAARRRGRRRRRLH